ncbi:thioesterase [Rhodobacteraceae bacterium 2CG4]|uniref:Thioesterase n=1 Tax=Halovulum marinum TaxID=2662447 RepID=A0A6L5Z1V9_9RHOB|nr:thioesterase family protein [Halovulum marinum]MSU90556.1 thioesterase [Halovulum marinum]
MQGGHDGPYAAPLRIEGGTVASGWLDYNGHMNVAWYGHAFDRAVERILARELGLGEGRARAERQGLYALQASFHYLAELRLGERFDFAGLLIDCDAKRLHLMLEMRKPDATVAATCEQILMNVDLSTRRPAPWPDAALARLARMRRAHADVPRPAQFARPLGLRRGG